MTERGLMETGSGHSGPTILLVDDEPLILDMVRMLLDLEGYSVLCAESQPEAVDLLERHPGPIAMLITDVRLKQGSGPGAAAAIRAMLPGIRVVFMSSERRETLIREGMLTREDAFLPKPFDLMAFRTLVHGRFAEAQV